jgi:hypothetical protein
LKNEHVLKPKRKSSIDLERPPIKRNQLEVQVELNLDSSQVLADLQVDDQAIFQKGALSPC